MNRESEPSLAQRTITVVASADDDTASCNILVSVNPINDNAPVVDLNGPSSPSINYTVELNYTFLMGPSSELVASGDATLFDGDQNGRIESVVADLIPGRPRDGIYLSGCPLNDAEMCLWK